MTDRSEVTLPAAGLAYTCRDCGRSYPVDAHGCRCRICRQAKAAYVRQLRNERAPIGHAEGITHGYAGYQEFKCRCEVCRAAKMRSDKGRRLRQLEALRG